MIDSAEWLFFLVTSESARGRERGEGGRERKRDRERERQAMSCIKRWGERGKG